jgi:hypothetical protein
MPDDPFRSDVTRRLRALDDPPRPATAGLWRANCGVLVAVGLGLVLVAFVIGWLLLWA